MSMVDDACPRCGAPVCHCQCKKPAPVFDATPWNPWNGLPPLSGAYVLSEHCKAFEKKVMGHIRREFAYRRLAVDLLLQLKSLENFLDPTTRGLLSDARGVWEKQLDDIAHL